MAQQHDPKKLPHEMLNLSVMALAIIGGFATVISCVIGFLTFISPSTVQHVIVELYSPPAQTEAVVVITVVPSPLPTRPPYPTYTPAPPQFVEVTRVVEVTREVSVIVTIPPPSATSTPSLILPFQDTFENGLRPEWRIISGEPIFRGGRLGAVGQALVLEIGDDALQNFKLEFDFTGAGNFQAFTLFLSDNSLRYNADACEERWSIFHDSKWDGLYYGGYCNGVGDSGHVAVTFIGNSIKVFLNGSPHYDFAYGSTIHGPLQVLFDPGRTIDNLMLTPQ